MTLLGGGTLLDPVTGGSGSAPDATTTSKGMVKLAGALGGTAASPTVPGLAAKADLVEGVVPDAQISEDFVKGSDLGGAAFLEVIQILVPIWGTYNAPPGGSGLTQFPAPSTVAPGQPAVDATTGVEYYSDGTSWHPKQNTLIAPSTVDLVAWSINLAQPDTWQPTGQAIAKGSVVGTQEIGFDFEFLIVPKTALASGTEITVETALVDTVGGVIYLGRPVTLVSSSNSPMSFAFSKRRLLDTTKSLNNVTLTHVVRFDCSTTLSSSNISAAAIQAGGDLPTYSVSASGQEIAVPNGQLWVKRTS